MSYLFELSGVTKTFGKGDTKLHALNGVDLAVSQGEMLAIKGVSGSGKSTLLNIIGLLTDATKGEYLIRGKQVSLMSTKKKAQIRNAFFGFVVQDFALVEKLTVKQNIAIPFAYRQYKLSSKEKRRRIEGVLEELGISEKINVPVQKLSGGQRQRVAIARALINEPSVILADEPTGALDTSTTEDIMGVLKSLNEKGKTIITITHDHLVAAHCNTRMTMSDGRLYEEKPA
ncbi:MAG: ABC transporter ATP-binding protein [Coriobacteriia bacterium]|nr:ABC transporter ATP-binding protein [Coriobacteriia bacterium]